MLNKWYYTHQGRKVGPISTEELLALAGAGLLDPFDKFWSENGDPSSGVEVCAALPLWGHVKQADSTLPDWVNDLRGMQEFGPKQPPQESPSEPEWLVDIRSLENQLPIDQPHASTTKPSPLRILDMDSAVDRDATHPKRAKLTTSVVLIAAVFLISLVAIGAFAWGWFLTWGKPAVVVAETSREKASSKPDTNKDLRGVPYRDPIPMPEKAPESVGTKEPENKQSPKTEKQKPGPPAQSSPEKKDPEKLSSPFENIDHHALAAPPEAEQSLGTLARYLTSPAKNETEKVRAIFRWITDRVAYDVKGYLSGKPGDTSATAVLKRRQSVCDGYARLFESLCGEAGIEAVRIVGSAKVYSSKAGKKRLESHAWNTVKIDGKWRLIDTTWAAGYVNGTTFTKRLNEFYFLPQPEELIFTHYPADPQAQLLTVPVATDEFKKWGRVRAGLFQLGVTADAVRKTLRATNGSDLVEVFNHPPAHIVLKEGPLTAVLKPGETVRVRIESNTADAIAFVQNGRIIPFKRQDNVFKGELTPKPGALLVSIKAADSHTYWGVLKYEIKE